MPEPVNVPEITEAQIREFAAGYDKIWFFKEFGQRLIELLDIKPGASVLDVACGTGMVLLPAAKCIDAKGHVTGIDINDSMLQYARQAVEQSSLNNTTLLKMDAQRLEFSDASFDAITCGFGIHIIPPAATLQEMYRVCKPGGNIGVTVWDRTLTEGRRPEEILNQLFKEFGIESKYSWPGGAFTPEEVESLLTECGFKNTKAYRKTEERMFTDAEDYWERHASLWRGINLARMDEETRARFKKDYLERLRLSTQQEGVRHCQHALFAIAQK